MAVFIWPIYLAIRLENVLINGRLSETSGQMHKLHFFPKRSAAISQNGTLVWKKRKENI